jgi:tetratricopeptide (TPR) repeat protein
VYSESVSRTLRKAFLKSHVQSEAVEDMIDFTAAAGTLFDQGEPALAAKLYRRCLRQAPDDAELHYKFAQCCVALKEWRLAMRFLRKGKTLNAAHEYDFTRLLRKAVKGLRQSRVAALTVPSTTPSVTDRRNST